jgi:hypothetical protein
MSNPNRIYNNVKLVSEDFGDDWQFTGASKVAAVQPNSSDYIYVDGAITSLRARLHHLQSMPTTIAFGNFDLTTTETEYSLSLSAVQDMDLFNGVQIAVASDTDFSVPQSFKCYPQPEGIEPDPYVTESIGCSFKAWYEDLGGGVYRIKVRSFRRFHIV